MPADLGKEELISSSILSTLTVATTFPGHNLAANDVHGSPGHCREDNIANRFQSLHILLALLLLEPRTQLHLPCRIPIFPCLPMQSGPVHELHALTGSETFCIEGFSRRNIMLHGNGTHPRLKQFRFSAEFAGIQEHPFSPDLRCK